jgi:Ser/Thr protein kinase RdoA (MazF antagonist)
MLLFRQHQQQWAEKWKTTLLCSCFHHFCCFVDKNACGLSMDAAREIASGLAYLHGCRILHGDLTGNNVLLSANSGDSQRSFTAKVDCSNQPF